MSSSLLAVALLSEDSDSEPESQSEFTNTETGDLNLNVNSNEAISHTEIECTPWDTKSAISHTGSENTAISHNNASNTKPTGRKRKQPKQFSRPAPKSRKAEATFKLAPREDGKVDCFFSMRIAFRCGRNM